MRAVPKQFLQQLEDTNEQATSTKKIGIDWRNVNFFDTNNEIISQLTYELDVIESRYARLVVA